MPKKPDLTGKKFGRLTVIEKLPISKNPTYWNCICECGKNKITTYTSLNTGLTQSCGCYRIDQVIKKCRINLAGKKFGRLTVINETSHHKNRTAWNCLCDCGKKAIAITSSLRNGMTRSCGCIRRERLKTHGMSLSSEYLKWQNMMQRCYYKKTINFHNYGGRGIKVCKRWHTFENFFSDMRKCPKGLTLERRDNNGNYEPSNCYWASYAVQNRNQRLKKTNKTGIIGVSFSKNRKKYEVRINNKFLGYCDTLKEAAIIRKNGEQKYWK